MKRKLVVRTVRAEVGEERYENLRTYEPPNPDHVCANVYFAVSPASGEPQSWFSLRVATPSGLTLLEARDGIRSAGPLVVMDRFEFHALWRWLEATVESCAAATWSESVERLRRHFHFGD